MRTCQLNDLHFYLSLLDYIISQGFLFVKHFFEVFFVAEPPRSEVLFFPYLVNTLQQKIFQNTSSNFVQKIGIQSNEFLCIFPIDKRCNVWYNGDFAPRQARAARRTEKNRHFNWRLS